MDGEADLDPGASEHPLHHSAYVVYKYCSPPTSQGRHLVGGLCFFESAPPCQTLKD